MLVIRKEQMQEMQALIKNKTVQETGPTSDIVIEKDTSNERNKEQMLLGGGNEFPDEFYKLPIEQHHKIYCSGLKNSSLVKVCQQEKSEKNLNLTVKAKIRSTKEDIEGVKFDLQWVKNQIDDDSEYLKISLISNELSPEGIPSYADFWFDDDEIRISEHIKFPYFTDEKGEYKFEPLQPEEHGHYEIKLTDTIIITDTKIQKKTPYVFGGGHGVHRFDIDGVQYSEIIIYYTKLECIIDSHMHIMSGHCTPLPILWGLLHDKISISLTRPGRREIILGAYIKYVGDIQQKSTKKIAEDALKLNEASYERDWYKCILLTPMVVLTMDMEYAHINGYKGEKIYCKINSDKNNNITAYYYRERDDNGRIKKYNRFDDLKNDVWNSITRHHCPLNLGLGRDIVKDEETGEALFKLSCPSDEVFSDWDIQIKETKKAVVKHPWKLLPMYHYDPRRWRKNPLEPFKNIATAKEKGLFIGFKMYTALGYRPLDPELKKLDVFYKKCEEEQIPIINHCTPGGSYTHEREFYASYAIEKGDILPDYIHCCNNFKEKYEKEVNEVDGNDIRYSYHKKVLAGIGNDIRYSYHKKVLAGIKKRYRKNLKKCAVKYFQDNFVRPTAWLDVLNKYPNLKLCLAHFGGDEDDDDYEDYRDICEYDKWRGEIIKIIKNKKYPNVYTDISYVFFEKKKIDNNKESYRKRFKKALYKNLEIKDRILFGTDWYLIRTEKSGAEEGTYKGHVDYKSYCTTAKTFIDGMSEEMREKRGIDIDFWKLFTHDNPFRFFGFDNEKKLMNIGKALIDAGAVGPDVRAGFYLMNRFRMALSEKMQDSEIKIIQNDKSKQQIS